MPALTTVSVGTRVAILYGSQGSQGTPLTVINLDTANTVYVGNVSNLNPSGSNVIPLAPLSSISFDGSVSVYAVTLGPQVNVAVTPGGNSYSAGQLTITGPVTAEITGPVDANIIGTPSVAISGTPTVSVTSGTLNANITNAILDILGSVTITPTVASLFASTGAVAVVPGTPYVPLSLLDVSSYPSYDLNIAVSDTAQGTAGHAHAYTVQLSWFDDITSGIPVFTETWSPWVSDTANTMQTIGTGPMHGQYMTVSILNASAVVGNISVDSLRIFGSPRPTQLSDWRQSGFIGHVTDSAIHLINNPSLDTDNMLADTNSMITLAANTNYMMPLGLYSGPIDWSFQTSGAIVLARANIINLGSNSGTQVSGSVTSTTNTLQVLPITAGTNSAGSQLLPRAACALIIGVGNPGGSIYFTATAQQGP